MKSIKDAMQQAFEQAGRAMPVVQGKQQSRPARFPQTAVKKTNIGPTKGPVGKVARPRPPVCDKPQKPKKTAAKSKRKPLSGTARLLQQKSAAQRLRRQGYRFTPSWGMTGGDDELAERFRCGRSTIAGEPARTVTPRFEIDVDDDARLVLRHEQSASFVVDEHIQDAGIAEQCHTFAADSDVVDERDLVMGLDFGSSYTKVVISDHNADRSYAVQFGSGTGLDVYLLASVLRRDGGVYSLAGEGEPLQSLKSTLMDSMKQREMLRVTAFLSLVIRQARGWFFAKHGDVYRNVHIVWSLRIGMPRNQDKSSNADIRTMYERMGHAAWFMAGARAPVSTSTIMSALSQPNDDIDCDVSAVAEIAAEIYGFVTSDSFDDKSSNIYMMVDVGGDTLDVSLFHVRKGRRGWAFSYFTSVVERLGVKQLARQRLAWWRDALAQSAKHAKLLESLEKHSQAFVVSVRAPDRFEDHFRGVHVKRFDGWRSPDDEHGGRVKRMVRQDVYQNAVRGNLVPRRQMDGIPMFVCGGGARMKFYSVIEQVMQPLKSSPLHAKRRYLVRPRDLVCEGLTDEDYDRLAVAYGLSKLRIESELDAKPVAGLNCRHGAEMPDYVSKDVC